jgi:predicted aconitase with swiveling domain
MAEAPLSSLNVPVLKTTLMNKLGGQVRSIVDNVHAAAGTTTHSKFAAIASAKGATHGVDVLLHGSDEKNGACVTRSVTGLFMLTARALC